MLRFRRGLDMDRHISKEEICRVFSGKASAPDVAYAVPHLSGCRPCWRVAGNVIAQLKREGLLQRFGDGRAAVIALVEEETRRTARLIRAQAWWEELAELGPRDQIERVKAVGALQTGELFETILTEARSVWGSDPYLAEHSALTAHFLVDHLPSEQFTELTRRRYRAAAMVVVANSRRLMTDWPGAAAALGAARNHLKESTDTLEEAGLLSIQASLECDTGNIEAACGLLLRAAAIYGNAGLQGELAKIHIQEAHAFFIGNAPDMAIGKAEEALLLLSPFNVELQAVAKSLITESLVVTGRVEEALRSFEETRHLYEELGESYKVKTLYLQARLADGLGSVRESEKLFRKAIQGFTERECYKDAFLARLALLESFFQREAVHKAERLCEEAIDLLQKTDRIHSQIIKVWRDLLSYVRSQRLKTYHLAEVRDYLVRHWTAPAPRPPLG
jgi:tetratricopeptide (TPR) repeat protein